MNTKSLNSNSLVIVFGLPGSGKSTASKIILERLGTQISQILRTDKIRKELFPISKYSVDENSKIYREFYRRTDLLLKEGKTVILDAVFALQAERDQVRKIAEDNSCPYLYVHVQTDENRIKHRIAQRF